MIEIESVSVRLGDVAAVDEVSLGIHTGLTAIIGPNGAGKSTLLAAIGRLVAIERGAIEVGGLDVSTTKSKLVARRVAILRQENHLSIRLSVEDLIAYGRFPHGGGGRAPDDRAHVERAIDLLDLQEIRGRFLDELSGGQRQRAFIAMAIAQNTDYLLLDEPLNSLDPRHAVALLKLLRQLVEERSLTVVVVLHDLNVAAWFADNVIAMQEGRIAHHGPVGEVMTAHNVSAVYETPVEVVEIDGRRVVLWQ